MTKPKFPAWLSVIVLISAFEIFYSLFPSVECSFLFVPPQAQKGDSVPVDERIQRVESGLLPAVLLRGERLRGMPLAERMAHYKVPGVSLAVINHGQIEWAKGYGVLERGRPARVTAETLFQAASISKPVAAMAMLHLVQEGRLNLDEDVNTKLISWKVPENQFTEKEKVTLRRIVSHSAGLTVHGFAGYAAGESVPTLVQILNGEKPANSSAVRVDVVPGTQWRYSGGGFIVMQQLMMDVTGQPFPQFMKETVLDKLEMTHSSYMQPLPDPLRSSAAAGYRSDGTIIKGNWHTYPEMAAAGLWTTPSDLARFAIELENSYLGSSERILSQEMARTMLSPIIDHWGLGIGINGEGKRLYFSHGGGNEGYRCFLVAYAETGLGAVVMTNSDSGEPLAMEIVRSIAKEYEWLDFHPRVRKSIVVDPKALEAYAGEYEVSPQFKIKISFAAGHLWIEPSGQLRAQLYPESETLFFSLEGGPDILFGKDASGKVTQLTVQSEGQPIPAHKIH